jgi:K(+)-stimulated pyrophosphate-energized sodium pump
VATKAHVRTAAAAAKKGMNGALSIAFSGGAVMVCVFAGLGLFRSKYYLFLLQEMLMSFSDSFRCFVYSTFCPSVVVGIYTKAADVGADLVVKLKQEFRKMIKKPCCYCR